MTKEKNTSNREYTEELSRLVNEFKAKFKAGTSNPNDFLTFSQMEMMLSELRHSTSEIYLDLFEDLIQGIDESELIRKKKPNTKPRESISEQISNTQDQS